MATNAKTYEFSMLNASIRILRAKMSDIDIYIIIVTYNAESWIDYSVGKLREIKTQHKIIVVDNNSQDNTCKLVSRNYPEVDLIKLKDNIGFGRANNLGIKKAYDNAADYILLLNQDAWLEQPDALDLLIKAHKVSDGFGIISPFHLDGTNNSLDYNFNNYISSNKKIVSDLYLKEKSNLDEIYSIRFVNAAIWLLPRQTVKLVGGFNPLFFMYGEDAEYINRCRYHNLKVGVVPQVRAHHGRPQTDSTAKKRKLSRLLQLVNLVDPNQQLTLRWYLRKLFADFIAASLIFDFKSARTIMSNAYFFFKNRTHIALSKAESKSLNKLYL